MAFFRTLTKSDGGQILINFDLVQAVEPTIYQNVAQQGSYISFRVETDEIVEVKETFTEIRRHLVHEG
jgi:hypothetical protein